MNTCAAPAPFLDEKKALACIHCGLCLSSCPTYLETGNENNSPRGRIYIMKALQSGALPLDQSTVKHLDLCLGCRACEAACPSGVQYGALLEETRDFIEQNHKRSTYQTVLRRFVIEKIFPHPGRMRTALLPARLVKATGLDRLFPKFARDPLDLLPADMNEYTVDLSGNPGSKAVGRVGFVTGCVMPVMFGHTHRSTISLLNKLGFEVVLPNAQGCCGALFAHGGNLKEARSCARKNIEAFEKLDLKAIIINAAGCGSTLKEYGQLLEHDPIYHERAKQFASRVKDITEFLAEAGLSRWKFKDCPDKVTYHDACHLAHAQRITAPPRLLVQAVAGSNFVELPESDVCCGSAGSYNLTEPEMAERLQKRKIRNIARAGATTVVTSNPGCILQIQAGLKKAGMNDFKVVHIADFLNDALASETSMHDEDENSNTSG
ncbi:MAG: (Fe-S)-binding protein [Verrucomicrobiales bacterium]